MELVLEWKIQQWKLLIKNLWNQEYTMDSNLSKFLQTNLLEGKNRILVVFFSSQPLEGTHLLLKWVSEQVELTWHSSLNTTTKYSVMMWERLQRGGYKQDLGPQMPKLKTSSATYQLFILGWSIWPYTALVSSFIKCVNTTFCLV